MKQLLQMGSVLVSYRPRCISPIMETCSKPRLWPDELLLLFSDYSKASFIFCLGISGLALSQESTMALNSTLIFFFLVIQR